MMKSVRTICLVACFAALSVYAENFPAAGGSYDIASVAAWGGTLPGTSDAVSFTNRSAVTVTASDDVSFGALQNNLVAGYNYKLTFDMTATPSRKLNFTSFSAGVAGSSYKHTAFKGGYWDFGGGSFCNGGGNSYGDQRFLTISDGAVITNTGNMTLGYTAQKDLHLELSGQSKLYVGGRFRITNNKTASGNENWVKITDGSVMNVAGTFERESDASSWAGACANQPDGAMYYKDYLIVDGEGSTFSSGSGYNYYGGQGGSATIVTNGGTLICRGFCIMSPRYSRNDLIRVVDGGLIQFKSIFYASWNSDASTTMGLRHGRIEVLDGGTLDASTTDFYLSYVNCPGMTLLVSNGTFCAKNFRQSSVLYTSNITVQISGPRASFKSVNAYTMFSANYSEYIIENGARFSPQDTYGYTTDNRHDETIRVRTGGMLTNVMLSTSMINPKEGEFAAWNNRLIAESGGIVTGKYVFVQGSNCTFRIDDATAILSRDSGSALIVGRSDKYGGLSTNCTLEIAGTAPKLTLRTSLAVHSASRILFELPEDGYQQESALITAGAAVTLQDGCSIEFSGAEALAERLAHDGVRETYVLIENPSGNTFVSDDVISAAQASLGSAFRLRKKVVDGKNQLLLTCGAMRGTTIILH